MNRENNHSGSGVDIKYLGCSNPPLRRPRVRPDSASQLRAALVNWTGSEQRGLLVAAKTRPILWKLGMTSYVFLGRVWAQLNVRYTRLRGLNFSLSFYKPNKDRSDLFS